jgi:hypothetical protein
MITIGKVIAFAVLVLAVGGSPASAQTVIRTSKLTGVTVSEATFDTPEARAFLFESIVDGQPVLEMFWSGPSGTVSGLAPRSAAIVRSGEIRINLDVASLIRIDFQNGDPGPCVGLFTAPVNDHATFIQSTEFSGQSKSVAFFPEPPGGIEFTTHRSGHGSRAEQANFAGTCAGAVVLPSQDFPNARMSTFNGNSTVTVTMFP